MYVGQAVVVDCIWKFDALVESVFGQWVKVHGWLLDGREIGMWVPAWKVSPRAGFTW